MLTFLENSIYQIKGIKSLNYAQVTSLNKLYMPIVGYDIVGLYDFLLSYASNQTYLTEDLIKRYTKMNIIDFSLKIHTLEAIGLIKTYFKQEKANNKYIFKVYSPLTSEAFFKNITLISLLRKYLGERETDALKEELSIPYIIPNGFNDISASFEDVFGHEFDIQIENDDVPIEDSNININSFDKNVFIKKMKDLQIDSITLDAKIDDIVNLCSLFAINEEVASQYIYNKCIDSFNNFEYDIFENFAKNYHHFQIEREVDESKSAFGLSDYSLRVKMMEEESPIIYVEKLIQADLPEPYRELIFKLSSTYKCSNSLINCILDYTFLKCKHSLPANFAYKVAISLNSQNITNANDAFSYLYQYNNEQKKYTKKNKKVNDKKVSETKKEENEIQDNQDVDFKDVLGDLI